MIVRSLACQPIARAIVVDVALESVEPYCSLTLTHTNTRDGRFVSWKSAYGDCRVVIVTISCWAEKIFICDRPRYSMEKTGDGDGSGNKSICRQVAAVVRVLFGGGE